MLQVTSTATVRSGVRAGRSDPVRCGFEHGDRVRPQEAPVHLGDLGHHPLPGQGVPDEDHLPVQPGYAMPAVRHLTDGQLDPLRLARTTGSRSWPDRHRVRHGLLVWCQLSPSQSAGVRNCSCFSHCFSIHFWHYQWVKLSEWARRNGVHYQTAWLWARNGKMPVPVVKTPTGRYLVLEQDDQPAGRAVAYCRVSSADEKADLERQAGRVVTAATGMGIMIAEVVVEVGSGLNARPAGTRPPATRPARVHDRGRASGPACPLRCRTPE